MSWSVGEVARLAKVSVRTLHHYDAIGLLAPDGRSAAGYRRYSEADLQRLQRILAYRQLGFDLEEIRTLLDDPEVDALQHLEHQANLLTERILQLEEMRAMTKKMMEARRMGINLNQEEILEVFGAHDPTQHAAEAQERWGESDAYKESQRRTRKYGKAEWQQIKQQMGEVHQRFIDLLRAGQPAAGQEAMDAAQAHRDQISRWFYPCDAQMHVGLAQLYLSDPRFTKTYEDMAPGLAQFVADAIRANAVPR